MAEKGIFIVNSEEYVIFNKKILKIVGLYPINLVRYVACLISMLLIVVPQIFKLYFGRNDFSVILETSSVLLTILVAILKSFVWLWNTGETRKVVEYLLNDYWRIAKSVDVNNRMEGYAKLARNVTRGYSFLIINALIVFFTLQPLKGIISKLRAHDYYQADGDPLEDLLDDEERKFPFPATYPKFCYESPFYEITYGSQTLATGICGLVILAMDTLIATALFHTCGHLKILNDNLSSLNSFVDEVEFAENLRNTREKGKFLKDASINLEKRLATLVEHHQLVIRFSDCMEKAFNPIMLLQVLASSFIICLVGFQVSSTISTRDRLVEYFSYFVMALFQIFLFCWPGGEIIIHSSKIGDAAFSINWYKAPSQLKMGVCLIILRSQKPNSLTAGKFHAMSMEYFTVILSTSLSYFTLLRSVNSE